jgi:PAS domain S-box-containing protein
MHNDNSKTLEKTTFFEIAKKVIVTDSKGNILLANPAFEIVTGYSVDEVIGKKPHILQSGLHDKKFYEKMWKEIKKKGFWKGEIWNKRKDGELFVEWLTISAVKDKEGNVVNYVAIFSDITEHKQNVEQLKRLAHYDILTGVANRYLFTKRLRSLIPTSRKANIISNLRYCF